MKTIIAGSRHITDASLVDKAVEQSGFTISLVLSGRAYGVDRLGELWAIQHGIPVKPFPADWAQHGKAAGFIRNVAMAKAADALLAVWDGRSKGTKHMITTARELGLEVFVMYAVGQCGNG